MIYTAPTYFTREAAEELAARLNADPEDAWTYTAEPVSLLLENPMYRIRVDDENGEEVGFLS